MELVAEIGPANGDIQYALDIVNAAKECGFHAVKGQIYDRDKLVTPEAKTYAHDLAVPETQYVDFANTLTYDEWATVYTEARRIGIPMFFSVFDFDAVTFCQTLKVERYKIASGDITYQQLLRRVRATGKPIVMSTGASTYAEVSRAVIWMVAPFTLELTLLACSLSYPTRKDDAHLTRMNSLKSIWPEVGYSDHTFGVGAMIRAKHLGAVMVEKHFTITPGAGGDHDFAVTPTQMRELVEWDTGDPSYDGNPELEASPAETKARVGARRSMHAAKYLPKNRLLTTEDVVMLRPGGGLEPWMLDSYVGKPVRENVSAGDVLQARMF
jgi:sialic acid synthase SpsE